MFHRSPIRCLIPALLLISGAAIAARGQDRAYRAPFEYDPYRVQLWVAGAATPLLAPSASETLASELARDADRAFGATWNVSGAVAPQVISRRLAGDWASLTVDEVLAQDKKLLDLDKLIVVGVRHDAEGFRVVARELDCRLRTWSKESERRTAQAQNIPAVALAALIETFAPTVRIENVAGDKVVTRLRAGGLITSDDSPAAVGEGALLQPVLRRNDRYGQASAGSIQRLPYTFLQVTKRDDFRVHCDLYSGVRGAISQRGARVEKLALLVRPQARGTTLLLRSKGKTPAPLVDYEVLVRSPKDKAEPAPIGLSDRAGSVQLPLEKEPLRMVYVRHGRQMLARIPVVPGLLAEQTLTLTDDDPRLAAEGYFVAMQNNILDLVARREMLAARIRLRIEKKQLTEAQQMLIELRALTNRGDLVRQMELQQGRFQATDKLAQSKVEKMFSELRKLLAKHLDSKLIDTVAGELAEAKKESKS